MHQHTSTFRLNLVLLLLIAVNIVNTIYPKGMGFNEEDYVGFGYQLSKYINAATIALMLPSLFKRVNVFNSMRCMVIMIIVYMMISYGFGITYNFSATARSLLICLSFVFFEETLRRCNVNKVLLYSYIITLVFNIAYLVITQDRLGVAIENEGETRGGQGIANSLIYLFPLIFLLFKDKLSTYLFLFCGIIIFISLRRTAILAYLFCIPFVYKQISSNISKKHVFIFLILFFSITYYIVNNYWFIIEDRFSDMLEANDSGYYGSGRTGWWVILIEKFVESPQNWLFGFGLGSVSKTMQHAGFPYGSAHNDYLEIIFTFGIVGGILWFTNVWKAFCLFRKTPEKSNKPLLLMYIFTYLLSALASGAFHIISFVGVALFLNLVNCPTALTKSKSHKNKTIQQKTTYA